MIFRRKPHHRTSPDHALAVVEQLRGQIAQLELEVASLSEEAEELRVKSLVSENTADVRDARLAQGHVDLALRDLSRRRQELAKHESGRS